MRCLPQQPPSCSVGEAIPAADQDSPKGSCAQRMCWAHTKWIGNDKSASHRQSWRLAGFRRGRAYPWKCPLLVGSERVFQTILPITTRSWPDMITRLKR